MWLPCSVGPWLKTHDSRPITHSPYLDAPNLVKPHVVSFVVSFLYSFPYIVKSKFGDYATLDALAEQRRVQGGTFDPRVLMDGSPSKAKICQWLMIEKVVDRIDELDQPHLKLMVMHDFMWALIEEQASNRAHTHQDRNRDSRWDSEVHDISQSVIDWALQPSRPTVCEYAKDQALTVNVLWEVAYGVCHEVLHLDSLEDFNATKADLMGMKNDILATWKSRDRRRTLSLGPTFISSSTDSKEQGSTLGKTFIPGRAATSISAPHGPSDNMGETSLPFFRPLAPPPRIPSTSGLSSYIQELLPTSYPAVGTPMEYNFDPMTGRPLKPLISSMCSPAFPTTGGVILNPHQPVYHRSVDLARAEQGGRSTSGWVPILLIPEW